MTSRANVWRSSEELLLKFDANGDGAIDVGEFRVLCAELFGAEEVDGHEHEIGEIFDLLDSDGDGLLDGEEWERCHGEWISVALEPVNVLLVVDVQHDFIDGTLALRDCGKGEDGVEVIAPINRLLREGKWRKVVYSLDWHPEDHIGFYDNLDLRELHPDSKISKEEARPFDTVLFLKPKLEQRLWPRHCVSGTWGARLHEDLQILPDSEQVRKGQNADMETYSVFRDNNKANSTELLDILNDVGATDVYVCGLAYDVCVRATCLDGLEMGYRLAVIDDCCRGVDPDDVTKTRAAIAESGGLIVDGADALALVNGDKRSIVMARQAARALAEKRSIGGKKLDNGGKAEGQ